MDSTQAHIYDAYTIWGLNMLKCSVQLQKQDFTTVNYS